jgi:hypothetical protein
MKTAIIVSDAWANALPHDVADYPNLEQEIRLYSQYLNYVMQHERNKGTAIIHDPTNRDIIDTMKTEDDIVLEWFQVGDQVGVNLPTDFDRYLICGFHYGRCIWDKLTAFSPLASQGKELGAIINLSHWLFRDSVEDRADRMIEFDNYIWTPKEITRVKITL